jgi:peptidoglycan hydrolase-like protein with peptidoglycan-binding domain
MMKKTFAVVFICVGLLFFNVASAQNGTETNQDLSTTIKLLQEQIELLKAQIKDLQAEVQTVKTELKFSRALKQGSQGDDVKQLQEFLKNYTGSYPDGSVTGYYGPLTTAAVKKFQAQNGLDTAGVVGPKTQEKLNVLTSAIPATPAVSAGQTSTGIAIPTVSAIPGLPTSRAVTTSGVPCKTPVSVESQQFTPTVIQVLSPNGGEQWQIEGMYTVKYSAKNITGNKALLIYLEKGYDEPTTKTGANSSILMGVTTNPESYTFMLPQNIQSWPGLGNNYKITIHVEGSYSSCDAISYIGDSSDATFSIVAGQNVVPKVSPAVPSVTTSPSSATIKNPSPTTTTGGGYGQIQPATGASVAHLQTDNQKITEIKNQILALQNQLDNDNKGSTRDSLTAQITEAEAQLKIIQEKINVISKQIDTLQSQLNTTTDTTVRVSLVAQITALKMQYPALDDKKNATTKQIANLRYLLSGTLDDASRISLAEKIAVLKAQLEKLSTPTVMQTATQTPSPTAIQSKINMLMEQITVLQNQYNATTDETKRASLLIQIASLKDNVSALQTPIVTPVTSTTTSSY